MKKFLTIWWSGLKVIISILVGIISIMMLYWTSSPLQIAINNPVTEEDYSYLKTYTLYSVQSPNEVLTNDNVKISKEIKQDYYHVKAILTENDSDKCGITAIFPILEYNETVDEDKAIHIDMKIDYDNVGYTKNVLMSPGIAYILFACMIGFFVGVGIYKVFNKIEDISAYLYKKYKKKKKEES